MGSLCRPGSIIVLYFLIYIMIPVVYNLVNIYTVNDRLSAAALIKFFRFLGAALIRLRHLF